MCGIFGQFNPGGADPDLIERMARCLDHRGPDGYGTYHCGPLAFGAGRLAIIDLTAGVQPIFSEDRRVAVVYNGEIYNYKALRAELEHLGHTFATQTDTEVIVHGYESWGADVVGRLRGMFALGIWDEPKGHLLLARDRLGEKPLYYTQNGDNFLFASEIKAFFEMPGLRRAVNTEILPFYLTLGYTPAPHTMFAGIEKVLPGELLIVDRRTCQKVRYWQPVMDTLACDVSYDEMARRVRQMLTEAVEMRLMSDVPLGAFLSGGVDSTAVVALMGRAMGRPVQTFTVGFDFAPNSKADAKFNVDVHHAALAARRLNTDHHVITVDSGQGLAEVVPHLIHAMDEPVAQPAIIQTAYVAALARLSGVPVLLSGDGSDELFAGYDAYRADRVLERYLRLPRLLRRSVLDPIIERLPARFERLRTLSQKTSPRESESVRRYVGWMKQIALDNLPDLLTDPKLAAGAHPLIAAIIRPLLDSPRTRYFADRIAFTSLNLWLAEDSNMRVDKMSMAMSIESRAPFEDHELAALALSTPLSYKLRNGDFKSILKTAVADLVPQEILSRPKWGFFPPASDWLRTVLRPLVETYLAPDRIAAAGFFRPEAVSQLVDAHIVKREYRLWPLWTLFVFQVWHASYIEGSLTLPYKIAPADLLPSAAQDPVRGAVAV